MLVTFKSDAHENITLFGDIAKQLLVMMGQSGVVPGAILVDDIPASLQQLQQALERKVESSEKVTTDKDDDEPVVSLKHRALPLMQLLQSAIDKRCAVLWTSG